MSAKRAGREVIEIEVAWMAQRHEVEARPTAVSELWIHRSYIPESFRGRWRGRRWTVTHRPTGLAVYYAHTLAAAHAYAKEAGRVSWAFAESCRAGDVREAHEAAVAIAEAAEAVGRKG